MQTFTIYQKEFIMNKIKFYNYSINNIPIEIGKIQGNRISMEDYYFIDTYKELIIIMIFDGHGGKTISTNIYKYLNDLHELIYRYYLSKISYKSFINSINKFFVILDKLFIKYKNEGSTISIIYVSNKTIYHVNLGDSKMIYINKSNNILYHNVLYHNILYQSKQHRPNNYNEAKRILKNNTINNNRIDNKLSVSRTIGDYTYKLYNNKYNGILSPVSCIPSYKSITIENNSYIILATDGFWDYITNNEILKIINLNDTHKNYVNNLIFKAIQNGSNDNIILILLEL